MKLNRTPNPLDRNARNGENDNWEKIERNIKRIDDTISDLVLESGGDSNLEVVQARGGKPVLNDRLNEFDSNLMQERSQRLEDIRELKENKADKSGVRLKKDKINPEDLSEDALELITGEGEVNLLSIPQDGSVTMPKFEVGLRQDLQDLFNSFVRQGDFVPIELFDRQKVKQGGVVQAGTTTSLTRTHIELDVSAGKNYYVVIPESEYLRVRSITSWYNNDFIAWNLGDTAILGTSFNVPQNANKVLVSFCKTDPSANLTVQETARELVSIFELRMRPENLIKDIIQGGITYGGEFTESLNRTRCDLITIPSMSVCKLSTDNNAGVSIRNAFGYKDGIYVTQVLGEGNNRYEAMFMIPKGINQVAVSYSKIDSNANLTKTETLKAKPKMEVSYK